MDKKILVDQYALTKLGADRGLGRYTALLTSGAAQLPHTSVHKLLPTVKASLVPEFMRIQADIASSGLPREVPYHATSVYHLPLIKSRPWICSIQDVITLDLEGYSRFGIKSRILFSNARRSDLIVANSWYTKQRVMETLRIPEEKIVTCPLPVSEVFHEPPSVQTLEHVAHLLEAHDVDISSPFVVALADLRTPDPRKRYHWIAELSHGLKELNIPTVVTGRGLAQDDFPSATVIQSLTDAELAALYSKSIAMYYPSAYEGQGLPPQEAMASGCPVVAYKNTSVQEVVGAKEFLLEDPIPWEKQSLDMPLPRKALDEAVAAIHHWAESRLELENARKRARNMALKYSYDRFADDLANVYRHAFGA
ncbi:glycosyltransferase [Arthrobacter sp. NQ4]|uniref:glycosyltransferase n=1 Tax=Arthrobacter sp. NQ4 TaxID=3027930 RepID=UPI0023B14210|nr:glycosyltransferase [Arthrobacter sp. NQ4]MDE8585927.1 glycosyltransferase [Arthrobacter sp. NQ4]